MKAGRLLLVLAPVLVLGALIAHGDAPGADTMAGNWANWHLIKVTRFPAEWRKYGKSAGPVRNQKMIDEGKPDLVVAFPGGNGTADMCRRAGDAGIRTLQLERLFAEE